MTDTMTIIVTALGTLAAFLCVVGLQAISAEQIKRAQNAMLSASERSLNDLSIYTLTPAQFSFLLAAASFIAFLLTYLATSTLVLGLFVAAGVFFAPKLLAGYFRELRLQSFDEKLPSALDELSNSARAGLSLAQCFEEAAGSVPSPVSDEFEAIVKEYKMGTDLEKALLSARDRIGSKSFTLAVSAFLVNIEKGGNLPEALETLAASLKDIWRLEQKLITASAEGRKAMWVISAVPVFVFVLVLFLQPEIAETLTTTLLGGVLLTAALCLYVGGLFWLKKILAFDV